MSDSEPSFWRSPQRSILGLCYMAGSVVAFAAGVLDGIGELIALFAWIFVTIGFYWAVHAVLQGKLFSDGA